MQKIHDIRQQIPQFSANFFPPYEYHPYPRMMVNKETGKPYKDNANNNVIVQDEHEEKVFLAQHSKPEVKEEAKAVEIPLAAVVPARQQFEAVAPAEVKEPVREKRKYTRKLPADLK